MCEFFQGNFGEKTTDFALQKGIFAKEEAEDLLIRSSFSCAFGPKFRYQNTILCGFYVREL